MYQLYTLTDTSKKTQIIFHTKLLNYLGSNKFKAIDYYK